MLTVSASGQPQSIKSYGTLIGNKFSKRKEEIKVSWRLHEIEYSDDKMSCCFKTENATVGAMLWALQGEGDVNLHKVFEVMKHSSAQHDMPDTTNAQKELLLMAKPYMTKESDGGQLLTYGERQELARQIIKKYDIIF